MPGPVDIASSKKRKSSKNAGAASKRRAVAEDDFADTLSTIQQLEAQIAESRKHYNNIATLISMLNAGGSENPELAAAVSLCRVFSRLMAAGSFKDSSRATENEKIVTAWLKERCQEYQQALVSIVREADTASQVAALTLAMRMLKERITHIPGAEDNVWSTLFRDILEAVIEAQDGSELHAEFVNKFLKEYEDVRFHTFTQIAYVLSAQRLMFLANKAIVSMPEPSATPISWMSSFPFSPNATKSPPLAMCSNPFFAEAETKNKKIKSVTGHKRRAQDAWLAVLRNEISQGQRKSLLRMMVRSIEPWFINPEFLLDFLTDSYNDGGATSLLALSGLFYLIQEKNLDYPQFYTKLYSLLDSDLLHSKHRSRFFRLLNTFLASTHLPAALIASFIKRLSRLALNAPHLRLCKKAAKIEAEGMTDPFDPNEADPMRTRAIESCVWEIESLQSHYHPNVAAIARIISEQFTKQAYNIEDFLDHTYQGMIQGELGTGERPLKKIPVVEYQIPKRIFTDRLLEEDGGVDSGPGAFVRSLWGFS
ncbi:hypothetical protein N7470_001687 [Penicillium chermesinum]|nr:hypothetical protein N7470_001687 [Penicillium chermesinum]